MDNEKWRSKAGAFVIRAMHKLWGKNNEDIMSWLFEAGFKNSFVKDSMFGISNKPMTRRCKLWGIESEAEKFIVNPGIIIPEIIEKKLKKVVVFDHFNEAGEKIQVIPGSSYDSIIKSNNNDTLIITLNLVDGFLIHQEASDIVDVLMPDNRLEIIDDNIIDSKEKYKKIIVLNDNFLNKEVVSKNNRVKDVVMEKSAVAMSKNGQDLRSWIKNIV